MDWARILAYVTGTVDQELLARNEYLSTENRILKAQLNGRLKLSDAERRSLGEIGHRQTVGRADFIRTHLDLLAGTDFFTAEVLTLRGLAYYVLFFTHLESRHHLRRILGAYAAYV